MEVAKLYATIGADASGLNKALGDIKSDLNVAARGFDQFQGIVTTGFKAIAVAGAAVFTGVVAGMTGAIKTAASLEQQAANTAAVFGKMAPPIQEVKGLISELGLDPSLVVGMEEAGAAINMLAKNGVEWEAIAGGVAKKTILLANATGADFSLAADVATDALAIFNLGVGDMDRAVSSAVAMMVNSKFDMQDFAYVLANLGPTAASLGISLEEMSALVTATASSFTSGRTSGTSFSLMLQNLTPQSDKASEAMRELNLITEDGKNVFFDANGNLKSLGDVLQIVKQTFGELTQEQQINYSRTIFGREAYDALTAILKLNNAEFDELVGKMGDMDAVMEGAKTRTSTFAAAWNLVTDTITALMGQIGDKFLPIVSELSREFAQFIADVAPDIVAWFGRVADVLDVGIRWLREYIVTGDLLNEHFSALPIFVQNAILAVKGFIDIARHAAGVIGEFVGQFARWEDVWTALAILVGGVVVKAIAGLVAGIAPLLAVIGAAIAVVAALRTAWENDWLGIRTAFEPIVNFILAGFRSLSDAFWALVADGKITSQGVALLWQIAAVYVGSALTMLWDKVQTAFAGVASEVVKLASVLDTKIREMTGGFITLQDVILGVASVLTVQWVAAWMTKAIPAVTAFLTAVAPFLGWVAAAIAIVAALRIAWETDWMGIRTAFEPVIGVIQRGFGLLKQLFDEFRADGKVTGEEWARLWDATQIVFARAGVAIWDATKSVFGNIWEAIAEFGRKTWDEFGVRFPKTAEALTRAWGQVQKEWDDFMAVLKPAINNAIEWFRRLVEFWTGGSADMADAIKKAQQFIDSILAELVKIVGTFATNAISALKLIIQLITGDWAGAWETLKEMTKRTVDAVLAFARTMLDTVKQYGVPWAQTLAEWGAAAWRWIVDVAIPIALQKLDEWGMALLKWVANKLPDWAAALVRWATAAVEWIGDSLPKAIDNFSVWVGAVVNWMTGTGSGNGLGAFLGAVAVWVKALWEWVQNDLWPKLGPEIAKLGAAIIEALRKIAEALWREIVEIARILVEKWAQGINERWQAFKDEVRRKWEEIRDMPKDAWDKFKQWGIDIVEGFRRGIDEKWTAFKTWWDGLWKPLDNVVRSWIQPGSPSKTFTDYGKSITDGLRNGVEGGVQGVFNAFDALSSGIMSRANALEVSLDGSLTQVAGRITALQNHLAELKRLDAVGAAQIAAYTMPTVSTGVVSTTPNNQGSALDTIATQGFGDLGAIGEWAARFARDTANYAGSLAYDVAAGAGLVGAAYRDAYMTLTDDKADTDAALIQALYTLVNALKAAPNDPKFQLSLVGKQTGDTYNDLSALVAYLNALYAS